MKKMLITGGAGFIGSHFVRRMVKNGSYQVVNLDLLTYAGSLKNVEDLENKPNYTFVQGDIGDKSLISQLFSRYHFDFVVNFAAESHVDRSIAEPDIFVKTNVLGTQNLLDCAKTAWQIDTKPGENTPIYQEGVRFLQVSTDEVYGALGDDGFFTENSPISPNSPYSASKASADLLVNAYHHTFSLPTLITRCSNNYGPSQFPEKLIPLMIQNAINGEDLPVYGDGLQVRDWLHVTDHCSAIETVLTSGILGEVYNVGGNNEKTNLDMVNFIIKQLGKGKISFVADRPGHDRRYAIDNHKITTTLDWKPAYTLEQGLEETILWYQALFQPEQ